MNIDLNSGGAEVLDRIIQAYGFKSKVEYSNHLGTSAASLSIRYKRDFFPSDLVVRCMAETGATLKWLATGIGEFKKDNLPDNEKYIDLKALEIEKGKFKSIPNIVIDSVLLPKSANQLEIVKEQNEFYIFDRHYEEITTGKYLVNIENRVGIYDLQRVPVGMVRISGGDFQESIECRLSDIEVVAKIAIRIEYL